MFNSQVELEEYMLQYGKNRAANMFTKNEEGGRAAINPYAKSVYKTYVSALAEIIKNDCESSGVGRRKAYVPLLKGVLDYETTAYLSIRTVLSELMQKADDNNARAISYQVGKVLQAEHVMLQYEHKFDRRRYLKLMENLQQRCSMDIEHRRKIVTENLVKGGFTPIDWGIGNREQVGTYLVEKMREIGLVDMFTTTKRKGKRVKTLNTVYLTEDALSIIENMRGFFEEMSILYLPTIEKPNDWTEIDNGGYHTERMKAIFNTAILGGNKTKSDCTQNLAALNVLQSVQWKVNDRILDVAKQCAYGRDMDEIVGPNEFLKPEQPSWLTPGMQKKDFLPEQMQEFKAWKKCLMHWHTECKLRVQKRSRMTMSFMVAEKFKNENEFYFVYQMDFRGRAYPRTMGVNPQGSDLQKALLHFAVEESIDSKEAEEWFYIHGANKFGFDKAELKDRVKWVSEHHDVIMACADDPMNYDKWKEADCPFQFLAWCFEYSDYKKYGKFFKSRLPVSMDGSCNGLQNFSAAFRDEVGGRATNLLPDVKPNDIYQQVADVLVRKLQTMKDDERHFISRWLKHGIKRSLVKRSVMTLPYGSTMFSARDFILKDYMMDVQPEEFEKEEYQFAALELAKVLWKSIGEVVIKAREAMQWLQESSSTIMKHQDHIDWETPTGFVVRQNYKMPEEIGQIRVSLFDEHITLYAVGKKADKRRHRNGIAPNFVHSLDAAHMQRVAIRCQKEGISSMAMIHDDFGTHAKHAARFNKIIREEFFEMYKKDYFEMFYERYKHLGIKEPPSKGSLDLSKVLDSPYFFC